MTTRVGAPTSPLRPASVSQPETPSPAGQPAPTETSSVLQDVYARVLSPSTQPAPRMPAIALPLPFSVRADVTRLRENTAGFRQLHSSIGVLRADIAALPSSNPQRAMLQGLLQRAETRMAQEHGYAPGAAPAPGTLWIDPQFTPISNVTGKQFPVRQPVKDPPPPMDVLFAGGRSIQIMDDRGAPRTVRNPEEYRQLVASHRAAQGMPRGDGEPVAVHLTLEGGGGKGKRYGAALQELASLGVVPTSVSGTSAGSIAAAMVAAGAEPAELHRLSQDPRLGDLQDINLRKRDGGLMDGKAAYDFVDQKLREITGIKDRPVTFADLKMPLHIIAAKMADSAPPAGRADLGDPKNRVFVFSQETTPNTPVALAVRASMSIPGAFDPVQMVDPTTARTVQLVDGGVLDNLPMGYQANSLPVVGLTLADKGTNHPNADVNRAHPQRVPDGPLSVTDVIGTARKGLALMRTSAADADDFRDRTQPRPGQFMLSVPTWDLQRPRDENSLLGFERSEGLDDKLDVQTREVTRDFFRSSLHLLQDPTRSATNTPAVLPEKLEFPVRLIVDGKPVVGHYTGGGSIDLRGPRGEQYTLLVDQQELEAMYIDHQAFGDMGPRLAAYAQDRNRLVRR